MTANRDAVEFDYQLVSNLLGLIRRGEHGWAWLSAALGVEPLTITYEDMVASPDAYEATVRTALDHLGVDHSETAVPTPGFTPTADDLTEDWVRRFEQPRRREWQHASPEARVVRRYLDQVWNERRYDRAERFLAQGHHVGDPSGPAAGTENAARFHAAFPDLHIRVDRTVTQDATVATWMTLHGTHLGPFRGHPPTGRSASWHAAGFWDVGTDGKISAGQFMADRFGLRQQLGILPRDLT